MNTSQVRIAVIGAGVVGMSCALWLQKKGFQVIVIDGNPPGSITSSGNACTIANYGCIPVNNPGLIRRLPSLMFGNNRPLSISPVYAITHLPWLLQFLKYCRKSEVDRIIRSLGQILLAVDEGLTPLVKISHSADLLSDQGAMYVYQSVQEFEKARESHQARAEQGADMTELDADDIRDLEPHLKMDFKKGLFFNGIQRVLNPRSLVNRYFDTFREQQGEYCHQHAASVSESSQGITVHLSDGNTVSADKAVIASGAFSNQIKGVGTEKLPLDTERGYHIQFKDRQSLLQRPVGWAEAGFYATPTNEGLRFAGTVEIAGLSSRKSQRVLDYLDRKAKQMFDLPESPHSDWLGYRPTLPDSLPVIGPSPQSNNILHAFGHQHVGLTLAGITGKIISELAAGEKTSVDISAFNAKRF